MKKIFLFGLLLGLALTNVSCKKLTGSSAKDLITSDTWQGVSVKRYDNNGNLIETISLTDWTADFNKDGTLVEKWQGQTMHTGIWELRDGDKKIYIKLDNNAGEGTYEIRTLTDNEFVYGDDNNEWKYKR